ncbi:MAG TPA: glycerol-3-phosphate dehydrogenase/oxidase [Nevskiales bacterium]|nr:glycerol-3-phosphate dehydrogenase/oxidase [Nevskiales bacterium]
MKLRASNIAKLKHQAFDVLIVGGGINGAVAAAALAGRGVSVALIDRGDFAGFTSQHSSNLAWGGIKYMESGEFGLVRKLCMSRNHLIRSYPSTIREIRFFTTVQRGFRWHPLLLWLGCWLYWLIGNGFTRVPRLKPRRVIEQEEPVINTDDVIGGFEYSDAYFYDNDARFVFNFIRTALNYGGIAANYVESLGARRMPAGKDFEWHTQARDGVSGERFTIRSRVLINAAGAFVDAHNRLTGETTEYRHVLSKGIHLVVDHVTPNRRVLAFFADDGRLFFAIPMGTRTCIGTTDTRVDSPFVQVTDEDRRFVLDNINKRLRLPRPLTMADVVAERCGVRPLAVKAAKNGDDGGDTDFLQLSRKHAIELNRAHRHVSIFGGKLTDCLNVGDEISDAVHKLGVRIPHPGFRWYGEPPDAIREEFRHQAQLMNLDGYTAPESSEPLSRRLWRRYGAQAIGLLENIREDPREAEVLIKGTEYIRCELRQAARREMIVKLDDFLRRRSKIALVERREVIRAAPGLMDACRILFGDEAQAKFDEYFREH